MRYHLYAVRCATQNHYNDCSICRHLLISRNTKVTAVTAIEDFVSILEPLLPYIHRIEPMYPLMSATDASHCNYCAKEVIVDGIRLVVPRVLEAEEDGTWSMLAIVPQATGALHFRLYITYRPSSLGT
jgi:hypothetical protein